MPSTPLKLFCLHLGGGGQAFVVRVDADDTVGDLKAAIKQELQPAFPRLTAAQLELFLAKRNGVWLADDDRQHDVDDLLLVRPLRPTMRIADTFQGLTHGTIHLLARIGDKQHARALARVPLKRKKRWDQLNQALMELREPPRRVGNRHEKVPNRVPFGVVTWDGVKQVFAPKLDRKFRVPHKPVPASTVELLEVVLSMKAASYGANLSNFDGMRWLFIEPILMAVSNLCGSKTLLEADVHLKGSYVSTEVTLNFLVTSKRAQGGYSRMCVIEAKEDTMANAMAKAFVAMEVVSELDKVETVYAIVVHHNDLLFMIRSDDMIRVEEESLMSNQLPSESYGQIAGNVYALLADD